MATVVTNVKEAGLKNYSLTSFLLRTE